MLYIYKNNESEDADNSFGNDDKEDYAMMMKTMMMMMMIVLNINQSQIKRRKYFYRPYHEYIVDYL